MLKSHSIIYLISYFFTIEHSIHIVLCVACKDKKKLLWCDYKKVVDLKNGGRFSSYELFAYISQLNRYDQGTKENRQSIKADARSLSITGSDVLIEISNNECIINTDFEPLTLQSSILRAARFTIEGKVHKNTN